MRRTMFSLTGLLALALVIGPSVVGPAQPRSSSPTFTELDVVEQGFQWLGGRVEYSDSGTRWGAILHNPNPDAWASGSVEATFTDDSGNVVGSDLQQFGHLGPDDTQAVGSFTNAFVSAEPARMTLAISGVQWFTRAGDDRGELAAEVVSDDLTEEGYRHVVIAIRSTLATDAWANPMFVLRDMRGTLLGVHEGWAAVPAGAEVGAEEVLLSDVESSANISVQADVDWSDEVSGGAPTNPPPSVRPLEVVEAGLSWSDDDFDPGTSWAALLRNPNRDRWVAQAVEVTATFRDESGRIVGADFDNGIGSVEPGQTVGVGTVLTWAPSSATVDVTAVVSWVQLDTSPDSRVTFDDVVMQDENGAFSGVTATMTVSAELVGVGIHIGVIYRAADGTIVGGQDWFELPEAVTSSIEIPEYLLLTDVTSVELLPSWDAQLVQPPEPAPDAGQFRPLGTFSPEVAANIPSPSDVSTEPPVVYANLILAALAVVALTVGVRLLNTTLVAHEDALEGFIRPAKALGAWWGRADHAVARHLGRAGEPVRIGGVLMFYGVLFSFLEPGWRPWTASGLFVLAAMAIAFGAVGTGDDLVELRSARRWGVPARLIVKPALVLFAVASVALTKFAGLVPGLLIGTPEAFSMEDEVSERDEARLAAVGLGSTAAIGLGAWAVAAPLDEMLDGSGGIAQGVVSALVTLLVLIFAVTVENLFANLLAFPGSEGAALRRRSRLGWWIMMLTVTALFFHTLINPAGDLSESLRSTNVRVVLITVGVFLLFTLSVWWWFRRVDRQPPAATAEPRDEEPAMEELPDRPPVTFAPPVVQDVHLEAAPVVTPRPKESYRATAVTTRQWVGFRLASIAMVLSLMTALVSSIRLAAFRAGLESESAWWSSTWSYVADDGGRVLAYAYPPILLWIGFAVFYASTNTWAATDHLGVAVRKAARTCDRATRRSSRPVARENLQRQLRERRHPYLFLGRSYARVGSWVLGSGLVLATALIAPATFDIATREQIADAKTGVIPSVCLVGSIVALAGLLLALPFGRSDRVVIDAMGNVRGVDERAEPAQPRVGQVFVQQSPSRELAFAGRPPMHDRDRSLPGPGDAGPDRWKPPQVNEPAQSGAPPHDAPGVSLPAAVVPDRSKVQRRRGRRALVVTTLTVALVAVALAAVVSVVTWMRDDTATSRQDRLHADAHAAFVDGRCTDVIERYDQLLEDAAWVASSGAVDQARQERAECSDLLAVDTGSGDAANVLATYLAFLHDRPDTLLRDAVAADIQQLYDTNGWSALTPQTCDELDAQSFSVVNPVTVSDAKLGCATSYDISGRSEDAYTLAMEVLRSGDDAALVDPATRLVLNNPSACADLDEVRQLVDLADHPDDHAALLQTCMTAASARDDLEGLADFQIAFLTDLSLDPDAPTVQAALLDNISACSRLDEMRATATIALREGFIATKTLLCAQASEYVGDFDGAEQSYQWFLDNVPSDPRFEVAQSGLARVLIAQARQERESAGLDTDGFARPPRRGGSGSARTHLVIYNDHPDELQIVMSGPESRIETVPASMTSVVYSEANADCRFDVPFIVIDVDPGLYDVLMKRPSYIGVVSSWTLDAGAEYSVSYCMTQG